jgi:hypothetical protein
MAGGMAPGDAGGTAVMCRPTPPTRQAGSCRFARGEGNQLDNHFRTFQAPMGMALPGDRLAVGATIEVFTAHRYCNPR